MAFLVNFATLNISSFLTATHYAIILIFVLAASLGVTFYNARLLKKERLTASADIRGKPEAEEASETAADETTADEVDAVEETADEAANEDEAAEATAEEAADETEAAEATAEEAVDEVEAAEATAEEAADEVEATEATAEEAADEVDAAEAAAEEAASETEADEATAEEPADEDAAAEATAEESADEVDEAEAAAEEAAEEAVDEEDLDLEPAVLPSEEERQRAKDELKELTEAISRLHSMDDYLDYADKESREHRPRRAVFAYKQALGLYWNDDYAPFIAINLGNTYKEMGDYEAASETYEAALALPATQKSVAMQQELHRSVGYLRTVQHILASHGIAHTPFAQIPPEVSAEIESAAQEA